MEIESVSSLSSGDQLNGLPELETFDPRAFGRKYKPDIKKETNFIQALLVAPSGGGKNIILEDLYRKWFKNQYDRFVVFSKTIASGGFCYMDGSKSEGWKMFNEDRLYAIMKYNNELLERKKEPLKTLVIFDDCLDVARNSKAIIEVFTTGRHYGISSIVLVQDINFVPPVIRNNTTFCILLSIRNTERLEEFIKGNLACLVDDDIQGCLTTVVFWKKLIKQYTNNKFNKFNSLVIFTKNYDNKIPTTFYNSVYQYKAQVYKR